MKQIQPIIHITVPISFFFYFNGSIGSFATSGTFDSVGFLSEKHNKDILILHYQFLHYILDI